MVRPKSKNVKQRLIKLVATIKIGTAHHFREEWKKNYGNPPSWETIRSYLEDLREEGFVEIVYKEKDKENRVTKVYKLSKI